MGVILADLRSTKPPRWTPPTAAPAAQLRAIVDVLPRELPAGNEYSSRVLADILLAVGEPQRAGQFAAAVFAEHRSSPLAVVVARAAARTGDQANAVSWLHAAAEATRSEPEGYSALLGRIIDQSPDFAALRDDPGLRTLRATLT